MANYTKGDWTLELRPADNVRRVRTDKEIIADVFGTNAEDEANARLIAKAPKMYEALKRLLNTGVCDVCYEDDCGGEFACTKGKYGEPCNCHKEKAKIEKDCYKILAEVEGE